MNGSKYLSRKEKDKAKLKLRVQAHYTGLLIDAMAHSVHSGDGTLTQDGGTYIFTTSNAKGSHSFDLEHGIAEALKRRLANDDQDQ